MISGLDIICYIDIVILQVNFIYFFYFWLNGDMVVVIQVNDLGVYILIVIDNNGCSGVDIFLLVYFDSLQFQIDGFLIFCFGDFIMLSVNIGMEFYLWFIGDIMV